MDDTVGTLPGVGLKTSRMPGHWVLARLGKKVLRPGGLELTRRLLAALAIGPADDVVEFAPGMGVTARLTLAKSPRSYTAVERDEAAARIVGRYASGSNRTCILASAEQTGLPESSATVVYGEAMLTMHPDVLKQRIIREAARVLRPGGRYGIHEMSLADHVDATTRQEVHRALTAVVHHGVRPLTRTEWCELLESEGFEIESISTAPMALLEPGRLVRDEGLFGALRFAFRALTDHDARRRVLGMRRTFRNNADRIAAIAIIARKKHR